MGMIGQNQLVSVALEYLGLMSPEQLKFNKIDSATLVWQLATLLYRVAFQDQHPFMNLPNAKTPNQTGSSNLNLDLGNFDQNVNAGLISQTRRNIHLVRYKKPSTEIYKFHRLQQVFDKTFCEPIKRFTLDEFAREICGNKLGLAVSGQSRNVFSNEKSSKNQDDFNK